MKPSVKTPFSPLLLTFAVPPHPLCSSLCPADSHQTILHKHLRLPNIFHTTSLHAAVNTFPNTRNTNHSSLVKPALLVVSLVHSSLRSFSLALLPSLPSRSFSLGRVPRSLSLPLAQCSFRTSVPSPQWLLAAAESHLSSLPTPPNQIQARACPVRTVGRIRAPALEFGDPTPFRSAPSSQITGVFHGSAEPLRSGMGHAFGSRACQASCAPLEQLLRDALIPPCAS